jgi:hypothetical protein
MTFPKARVIVAACLFLGWLGFLLYLVVNSRTVVLSKPQFMRAQVYAIAEIQGKGRILTGHAQIVEILWCADAADQKLVGEQIELPRMIAASESSRDAETARYLVALEKTADGKFEIAPVPHTDPRQTMTHGTVEAFGLFSHRVMRRLPIENARMVKKEWEAEGYVANLTPEELRIYPWTPDTRAQAERLIAVKE